MIEARIRVRCSRCERTLMPPPGACGVRNDDTFDTLASAEYEATKCGWTIGEEHGDDAYCRACGGPEPDEATDDPHDYGGPLYRRHVGDGMP